MKETKKPKYPSIGKFQYVPAKYLTTQTENDDGNHFYRNVMLKLVNKVKETLGAASEYRQRFSTMMRMLGLNS
jgi:hypothetical protein